MERNTKDIKYLIISAIIANALWIIYCQMQKKYFLLGNNFTEWIEFSANGLLVLIGAFGAILAVILTIKYAEKDKIEKKELYEKIIKSEIVYALNGVDGLLFKIYSLIRKEKKEIDEIKSEIDFFEFYTFTNKFEENVLEYIKVSNDIKKINELQNFLRIYKYCINLFNGINNIEDFHKKTDKIAFEFFNSSLSLCFYQAIKDPNDYGNFNSLYNSKTKWNSNIQSLIVAFEIESELN